MNRTIILFAIVALILSSCGGNKDGDVEGILFQVSPEGDAGLISRQEGAAVKFSFSASSEFIIKSVEITRAGQNEITDSTVFYEEPGTNNYSGNYNFFADLAPVGSSFYIYKFIITDVQGNKTSIRRLVAVSPIITELKLLDNITLSSSISSSGEGAYNLLNQTTVSSDTVSFTSSFVDVTDTTSNPSDTLSMSWIGVNGTEFVRINSFAFENATYEAIEDAIVTNNTVKVITALKNNDIILMKYKKNTAVDEYVVVKIISITDAAGKDSDAYTFSLKYRE